MKVKATATGFDNLVIRNEGDVFDMPEGSKGTWFEPLPEKQPEQKSDKQGKQNRALTGDDLA